MSVDESEWRSVSRGAKVSILGGIAMVAIQSLGLLLRAVFGGEAYGLFVIARSAMELMLYLTMVGFVDATVVFASRRIEEEKMGGDSDQLYRSLATCIGVPVLFGVAVAVAVHFIAPLLHQAIWSAHDPTLVLLVQRLAWALPLFALMHIPVESIKARLSWGPAVWVVQVLVPSLTVVGALVSHLMWDRGILALVDGVLFALLAALPISWTLFSKAYSLRRLIVAFFSGKWDLKVLSFAFPQGVNMMLNQGLVRIDGLMLSAFVSADTVGIYTLASDVTQNIRVGKMVFSGVYAPVAARFYAANRLKALSDALHRMVTVTSTVAIPLLLVIMSIYPALILHPGERWPDSTHFAWFLTIGPLMSCFFGMAGNTLLMMGRSRLLLINAIIAGTINVVLNWLFIPRWGLMGAAVATAIASFSISSLQILELAVLEKIKFRLSIYAKTVAAAALPVLLVAIVGAPSLSWPHDWSVPAIVPRAGLAAVAILLFAVVYALLPGGTAWRVWRHGFERNEGIGEG